MRFQGYCPAFVQAGHWVIVLRGLSLEPRSIVIPVELPARVCFYTLLTSLQKVGLTKSADSLFRHRTSSQSDEKHGQSPLLVTIQYLPHSRPPLIRWATLSRRNHHQTISRRYHTIMAPSGRLVEPSVRRGPRY